MQGCGEAGGSAYDAPFVGVGEGGEAVDVVEVDDVESYFGRLFFGGEVGVGENDTKHQQAHHTNHPHNTIPC